MTTYVAAGSAAGQAQLTPNVVYAPPGWAANATGKDDTAVLAAALNAARATVGGVGTLVFDATTYFLSGPLDCHSVRLLAQVGTRITLKSDWAAGLPCTNILGAAILANSGGLTTVGLQGLL